MGCSDISPRSEGFASLAFLHRWRTECQGQSICIHIVEWGKHRIPDKHAHPGRTTPAASVQLWPTCHPRKIPPTPCNAVVEMLVHVRCEIGWHGVFRLELDHILTYQIPILVPNYRRDFPVMRLRAVFRASVFVTDRSFDAVRFDDKRGEWLVL